MLSFEIRYDMEYITLVALLIYGNDWIILICVKYKHTNFKLKLSMFPHFV